MVGLNIYIISLKDSQRRKFQTKQFDELGLDFRFFDAIESCQVHEKHNHNDWERPLKISEVACYKSHLELWKRTISNQECSLILEDDALI